MSEQARFVDLIKVIQAPPQDDDEIRILTLELYEDGFIIRFVLPGGSISGPMSAEEASLNPYGLMSMELRDEAGTAFERIGGGASSGGMRQGAHGTAMYVPPIPAESSWLDVLVKGGFVRFDLTPR